MGHMNSQIAAELFLAESTAAWICDLGLEWAYRLGQEPTRRYLVDGLPFALRVTFSAATHRARNGSHRAAGAWND